MVVLLKIHLRLPGCTSLKEKRGRLRPLLARLHREFNLSSAELGLQDAHQFALIGCAILGNDSAHLQSAAQTILRWLAANWSDGDVLDEWVEMLG